MRKEERDRNKNRDRESPLSSWPIPTSHSRTEKRPAAPWFSLPVLLSGRCGLGRQQEVIAILA